MKDMYGRQTYNQISDGDGRGEDFLWSYIHELKIIEKAFGLMCDDLIHKRLCLLNCITAEDIKNQYIDIVKKEEQKSLFMGLTPDDFKEDLCQFTKEEDKNKKVSLNWEY